MMNHVSLPRFCERFCIGLTGGIASGKSTASAQLAQLGAAVVDTDVIAHQLTQPSGAAMAAIESAFGCEFINADGSLNRSAMRALVFSDSAERARLEAILHPMIHAKTRELGSSMPGSYVVFVVPLLVEGTRWRQQVDRIAVLDCEPNVQLARLIQRPSMTVQQAQQIIAAQASREQRLAAADLVIANHGNQAALQASIQHWHQTFSALALAHMQAVSAKLEK
jgi:dephospho-CoA kinase